MDDKDKLSRYEQQKEILQRRAKYEDFRWQKSNSLTAKSQKSKTAKPDKQAKQERVDVLQEL